MKESLLKNVVVAATCAVIALAVSPAAFMDLQAGLVLMPLPTASDLEIEHKVVSSSDDPVELSWRALAALDYRTGEMSDQLRDLVGKPVKIPGFTVPLEDFASAATEFLLVPFVGACVHTPPPPPNQLVYVKMDEGRRAMMDGCCLLYTSPSPRD